MICGIGCRRGSGPVLLWPGAVAPIGPLAWEPPYVTGVALKRNSPLKNKKKLKSEK